MCCRVSHAYLIFQVHVMSFIDGEKRHHLKYTRQYDWYVDIYLNNWTSLNPTVAGAREPTLSQRIWFPWSRSSLHFSIDSSLDNIITLIPWLHHHLPLHSSLSLLCSGRGGHPPWLALPQRGDRIPLKICSHCEWLHLSSSHEVHSLPSSSTFSTESVKSTLWVFLWWSPGGSS